LESGEITVTRVGGSFTYPSRFTLVAAMNPCPCGFFGSDRCRCKSTDVKRYQSKISGPISDRIDLQVTLKPLTTEERFAPTEGEMSPKYRAQVEAARQMQVERFKGTDIAFNAAIPGGGITDYCKLSGAAMDHYKSAIDANTLSTRSMDRLAKVARTAADLEGSDSTEAKHIDIAAHFVIGGMLRDNF
jgi:magnesium chelatase family protein